MEQVSYESKPPLIIIVEDDPGNAHLLETILQEESHCQTETYQHGECVLDHLEEIAQRHPALFLVDYTLPGIHGLALCHYLHTYEQTRNVPTVLVTGSAHMEGSQEAEQHGIRVLVKPFDLDEFLAIVAQEVAPSEPFS